MNPIRERVKNHLPTVLLTLLSIVQALALELLWTHLTEAPYLYHLSWMTVVLWAQIVASFLGFVLIWVAYASAATRFRWVPKTSDSVFPFIIGILEFSLVEALEADSLGLWFILMASVYGVMIAVTHLTMRRARMDSENAFFFNQMEPAQLRSFYPAMTIVTAIALIGIYYQTLGRA